MPQFRAAAHRGGWDVLSTHFYVFCFFTSATHPSPQTRRIGRHSLHSTFFHVSRPMRDRTDHVFIYTSVDPLDPKPKTRNPKPQTRNLLSRANINTHEEGTNEWWEDRPCRAVHLYEVAQLCWAAQAELSCVHSTHSDTPRLSLDSFCFMSPHDRCLHPMHHLHTAVMATLV